MRGRTRTSDSGRCFALLAAVLLPLELARSAEIVSPDGRLMATIDLDENGGLEYQLFREEVPVTRPSPLGLQSDIADFRESLRIESTSSPRVVRETYRLWTGKQSDASYRANEITLRLASGRGETLIVTLRLSDDGLAWRYELPGPKGTRAVIEADYSGVHFFPETRAWLQPKALARSGWSNVNPSYEEDYYKDIAVGEPAPGAAGWVFPALFSYRDNWLVLTEAGMDGTWPGSNLAQSSEDGVYRLRFPQAPEVVSVDGRLPQGPLPLRSPWRILAVGDLATIVGSTLGTDLADPLGIADTGFVEPGAAAWSWGVLKDESVVYPVQETFVDYAAQMGWKYVLVDVNWDENIGFKKIEALADYADRKGVGLFLWYNSSGDWNETTYTPKGRLLERTERRREFARLQSMGIRGVKVDFFPGDGASVIRYYIDLLSDAAEHELMVNFHGSTLPRGLHRTYPNLVTSEAVKGFEFVTFEQENADREATQVAMLPFTRNLFDPMDFTPTVLGEIPGIERRTSNGFQLALPVLLLSGVQHIVTTPAQMAEAPDFVRDYLGSLPAQWDESRLLAGHPGHFVVIARRAGGRWYVAGVNANEPRRLELDLGFADGAHGSMIFDDEDSPGHVWQVDVDAGRQSVELEAGSGFVMVLGKEEEN